MLASYLLVAVGFVCGIACVVGVQLYQLDRARRDREAYFRDVDGLARRGGRR